MNHHDREPDPQHDTPPALRVFVTAARDQPIVPTRVTAEAVAAGLAHHNRRSQSRRTLMLSAAVAVAASVVAVSLLAPLFSASDDRDREALEHASEIATGELPTLASAVRLRSTDSVVVHGAWSIGLGIGTHELEVDSVPGQALAIALPGRKLELARGRMTVEVSETSAAVRLHTGVAAWIDEHGQRTSITIERLEFGGPDGEASGAGRDAGLGSGPDLGAAQPGGSSAVELAREAELLLAAGKRDQAVEIYRQLARKHPNASQTRAAVLDLARLLRIDGRMDEARCAYQLYLERWPKSSVRAEVESRLDRLGDGPGCRGLRVE